MLKWREMPVVTDTEKAEKLRGDIGVIQVKIEKENDLIKMKELVKQRTRLERQYRLLTGNDFNS